MSSTHLSPHHDAPELKADGGDKEAGVSGEYADYMQVLWEGGRHLELVT